MEVIEKKVSPKSLTGYAYNSFDDADPHRVERLVASIEAKGFDEWCPVIVVDGEVANGRHRVLAAQLLELDVIPSLHISAEDFESILDSCSDLEEAAIVVEYHAG